MSRRQNCEITTILELTRSKREWCLFRVQRLLGAQSHPRTGSWDHKLVTLVVNEVIGEGLVLFNYSRILSQGDAARPMISGLVRIVGGYIAQGRALEPKWRPCQFHLSGTRSRSDTGKLKRRGGEWGKRNHFISIWMRPVQMEIEILPPKVSSDNYQIVPKLSFKTPFCCFPAAVCPQANLQCPTLSRRRFQ